MMKNIRRTFHVVPERGRGWTIKMEGVRLSIATYPTKDETLEVARSLARANQKAQLVLHHGDGTVDSRVDYASQDAIHAT
ncbi:MAG: DUF2188 domain-containing protein [Euryarchaeota archaeon]|nr:DUF2188 domain-containing protein [Euryarchaeota archaeon]